LDWGLGHASRCVPLIRRLQSEGDQVWIASAGTALQLLAKECPELTRFEVTAYGVRYPTACMAWNLAIQAPRLLRVMRTERQQAAHLVRELHPTRVVSDGRFAFYDPQIPNIWLAHQLQIQHPAPILQNILNRVYHAYLRQVFQEVWVPDWPEAERSLAGALATPVAGLPHRFLGPLSRYAELADSRPFRYDLLCLLSGPEPQRSRLEAQLRRRFAECRQRTLLLRGKAGSEQVRQEGSNFYVVDWLHGQALAEAVAASARILCRSGYSSLMDLYYWQKPAVLVPTPGQTEQLYLARYWQARGWAEMESNTGRPKREALS
ncbi:MAG: hypothetical protein D6772_01760, partial [Bacteroidetes bacterium]